MLHEALGEVLRAFELSPGLRRAYDGNVLKGGRGGEVVVDAVDERVLGAHDDHADAVVDGKAADGLEVVQGEADVLCLSAVVKLQQ